MLFAASSAVRSLRTAGSKQGAKTLGLVSQKIPETINPPELGKTVIILWQIHAAHF